MQYSNKKLLKDLRFKKSVVGGLVEFIAGFSSIIMVSLIVLLYVLVMTA